MNLFLPTAARSGYINFYNNWLRGLLSEIAFWRSYMETKGLQWSAGFAEAVSPDKKFPLEEFVSTKSFGDDLTGGRTALY